MKPQAFRQLRDLEKAFSEFKQARGYPGFTSESKQEWSGVQSSSRLEYARSLNDFAPLVIGGKFPPRSQFLILCALQVYGSSAFEYWRVIRAHYCRGKPRGSHAIDDEALDVWYAVDAWLQSWLYSPLSCPRPPDGTPGAWLYAIRTTDPTPHLRMSHSFLCRLDARLPANYTTARRNLHDVKGVIQRYAIVESGSRVPNLEALFCRFPCIGLDIWHKAVYLLTNDVKPPSHYPMFGWRHQRVSDYFENHRLFPTPEIESVALGTGWSLHGILFPQQLETLKRIVARDNVRTNDGPPITSGRMLRRMNAR